MHRMKDFWHHSSCLEEGSSVPCQALSPQQLQFKSILRSWMKRMQYSLLGACWTVERTRTPVFLWHFRANFCRMIRESCGNLNLRADLYLPVVLLLLTSRGNKSAVLQADRLDGGRSPFSPFFYEHGKICHWLQDWRSSTPRQSCFFTKLHTNHQL